MAKEQKLTPKQNRFIEEYLIDLNATQAAIRAGYSKHTANEQGARLLANVSIQQAIAEKQQARAKMIGITQNDVITGLLAEAQNTGNGSSHSARVKAWEILGKHLGMFRDQTDVNFSADLPTKINVIFDDEERYKELVKEVLAEY